ncbi:mothers against decapentaplegic homolog 6 [Drosophila innubila]|uniref:mothers against decapentaplegic homolog 6 n=1 Tax=Drosophila innubila TaxID=198719 RepID=UPI00148DA20F|nr:mothers against decapentaplegic homolog 6 [Drosophila innubila]
MIFPSEKKKELLRYASRNNPATCDADGIPIPMQQPQRHLPQHQRLPQTSVANCCCCCANDPSTMRQLSTPPPPYCLISCSIDYSGSYRPNRQHRSTAQDQQQLIYRTDSQVEVETEADMSVSVSASATEESDYSYMKGGCSYASSGADLLSDENGLYPMSVEGSVPAYYNTHPEPVRLFPTTFAATAANMFRNCCGGGHTTDSSSGSTARTSPPDSRRYMLNRQRTSTPPTTTNTTTTTCPIHPHLATVNTTGATLRHRTLNQNVNALLKPFKNKQIAELLQAVKSRVDPPPKCNSMPTNNNTVITSTPSYLQCILIKCTSPLDEDQHVTTCQLFFWSDLRDGRELRRLPSCPTARDYVYTCCNPLHWYRIMHPIDSESAPPPYQRSKMLRLRDTDSEGNTQNIDNHHHHSNSNSNNHSQSISSIIKQAEPQLYVPSLESFTTDGKDRSACSKVWCQIAYWELSQRVGEFFHAKKLAVNIHADGPIDSSGVCESMCLRDLGGKRPPTDAVQNTRQKVGLGVTLSLECGDVWIYNRSNVPIFVDSPTLAERLDRVCKVMPGYCLKAFETHRAQWLACKQSQHNQLGPIDRFSMKISFAKGWGNTYRRQDVMGCPCWLEVHFNHLR